MNERLRSPPLNELGSRRFPALARCLGEASFAMKFYAPIKEDIENGHSEPTMAQRLGGDVIVVRVGAHSMGKKKIRLAAKTLRAAHDKAAKTT